MTDNYSEVFKDVKNVLCVFAHPDDMDVVCGGTVARLVEDGVEVNLLVCTNGALGSKDNEIDLDELARIRHEEQLNALKSLGLGEANLSILDFPDCSFGPYSNELIEKIVFEMRTKRPELIITHDPENMFKKHEDGVFRVNHRDHRAVAGATINAIMPMARDISFFPEHKAQGLHGVCVRKVMFGNLDKGNVAVDFSKYLPQKRKALESHKSQLNATSINNILGNKPEGFETFTYLELK